MSNFVETLKSYLPASWTSSGPIVPVLRFSGAIGVVTPLRPGLSLSTSAAAIEKAFAMSGAKAVAIQINSPGGSAVQSMLIYKRIRALAAEKDLKVYVFAEDVAASGGYLLACAGDEIYADPSSIVGSIGVITATFGVSELINRIGVQRRVYTAGESKDTLDPFLPEKPADVERIKALQRDVHEAFIDLVKSRRGAKIDKGRHQSVHRRVLVRQEGARVRPHRWPLGPPQQDARGVWRRRASQAGDAVDLVVPPQAERICRERRFRARLVSGRPCRRSHLGDRSARALVAFRVLGDAATPHLRRGRRGVVPRRTLVSRHAAAHRVSELRAAEEALERRERESVVPLEQDPATGVYRPKRGARR